MTSPNDPGAWILGQDGGDPPRARVFCFPHAGGGASAFLGWARSLPSDVRVHGVQLPGRENRLDETAFEAIEPLVAALMEVLAPRLDRPYALFGYSVGGLLAFEVGRRLAEAGAPRPLHLFVAASTPPHAVPALDRLADLDDVALFREVHGRYGGVPDTFLEDPELRDVFVRPLRADLRVLESYRGDEGEPVPWPITAFGGTRDHQLTPAQLMEWRRYTTGPFASHLVPGGHFFLRESGPVLLDHLSAALARAFR